MWYKIKISTKWDFYVVQNQQKGLNWYKINKKGLTWYKINKKGRK